MSLPSAILELGATGPDRATRADLTAALGSVLLPSFVGAFTLQNAWCRKNAGMVYRHLIMALLIITGIIAVIFR